MLDLRRDQIGTVRVRTSRPDGARVRLAEGTSGALHPAGLAPEAILVMRRAEVAWSVEAPDAGALPAAVRAALPRARRPATEWVGDDADVVLFASLEELLACLARDVAAGRRAWWWKLLGHGEAPVDFVTPWIAAPTALPGVVRRLVDWRVVGDVVRRLHAEEGRRLLAVMAEAWRLDAVAAALPQVAATVRGGAVPWAEPAGEVFWAGLPAPVRAFVGVAAVAAAAPVTLRTVVFGQAFTAWAAGSVERAADEPQAEVPVGGEAPVAVEVGAPVTARAPESTRDEQIAVTTSAVPSRGAQTVVSRVEAEGEGGPPAVTGGGAPGAESRTAEVQAEGRRPEIAGEPEIVGAAVQEVPAAPEMAAPDARVEELSPEALPVTWAPAGPEPLRTLPPVLLPRFKTELGGAFYLFNVLLALDLYGDFTQPMHPDPEVPIWDVVAMLTARLCPDAPPDPLWAFFAALGGRSAIVEAPTLPADFTPPGDGWVLSRPLPAAFPRPAAPTTEAWLDAVEAGVRARLTTAIELAAETWLRQRGRVRTNETLVEVRFSLADHPIEVRIAGLDRDPGWIPAAGRDLRFGYDA